MGCAKTRVTGKVFVWLMATCGLPAGLHIFIQARPDVVILEVGIGGRIDATNIVKRTTVTGTRLHMHSAAAHGTLQDCKRMHCDRPFVCWGGGQHLPVPQHCTGVAVLGAGALFPQHTSLCVLGHHALPCMQAPVQHTPALSASHGFPAPRFVASTGITSLGFDHMELLGDTLDLIAREKAGIMRQGVPCFTVPQPPEAMQALQVGAVGLFMS